MRLLECISEKAKQPGKFSLGITISSITLSLLTTISMPVLAFNQKSTRVKLILLRTWYSYAKLSLVITISCFIVFIESPPWSEMIFFSFFFLSVDYSFGKSQKLLVDKSELGVGCLTCLPVEIYCWIKISPKNMNNEPPRIFKMDG